MKNKIFIILFIGIFLIGIIVRFYKLGEIPNSLDWDEVSQGYNAYSILETGKDEFGVSYPLTMRSLNDYKPPLYTYLTIIPIKIFGLSAFSVRFPSALFGSLSILLVFALIYEIFRKEKYGKTLALLSMFFFSISPMSIQFSRTGFDANVAVFFVLLGTWLFVRYLYKKIILPIFVAVFFLCVSVYATHSEKVFIPLFFACLIFYGWEFFTKKRIAMVSLIIFFAFLNIFWFLDSNTKIRSKGVLFTSPLEKSLEISNKQLAFDQLNNDNLNKFLHNRRLSYVSKYIENYLSHFDLNYLFIHGDTARHHAPGMGALYLVSLPFIVCGIIFLIRKKVGSSSILFAWFFIAPIASAFAIDAPNYQRSLIFLPTFPVFEALGWIYLFSIIIKKKLARFYISFLAILLIVNMSYYLHQYFVHTNTDFGKYWQYGYKEAIVYTKKYINTEKRIFFAHDIEQGYIFYLFYNNYDPQKYLSFGGSNRISSECYAIDNAYFGLCRKKVKKGDIFITSKEQSLSHFKLIKKIDYASKETGVWIFEYL